MSDTQHILIIEDEVQLAELMHDYLVADNFKVSMLHSGENAVSTIKSNAFDMILLDIMLPEVDGIQICKQVRDFSEVPIIMTTAKIEEIDRVLGLELGADDYVCKPYSPRELIARVKGILRRLGNQATAKQNGFKLDEDQYIASIDGQALDLTPVEFRLLKTLCSQPGRIYSRNQLLDNLYLDQRIVTDRTIDTHVKNLRKKLAAIYPDKELIQSIYGLGYKLLNPSDVD